MAATSTSSTTNVTGHAGKGAELQARLDKMQDNMKREFVTTTRRIGSLAREQRGRQVTRLQTIVKADEKLRIQRERLTVIGRDVATFYEKRTSKQELQFDDLEWDAERLDAMAQVLLVIELGDNEEPNSSDYGQEEMDSDTTGVPSASAANAMGDTESLATPPTSHLSLSALRGDEVHHDAPAAIESWRNAIDPESTEDEASTLPSEHGDIAGPDVRRSLEPLAFASECGSQSGDGLHQINSRTAITLAKGKAREHPRIPFPLVRVQSAVPSGEASANNAAASGDRRKAGSIPPRSTRRTAAVEHRPVTRSMTKRARDETGDASRESCGETFLHKKRKVKAASS
ncbi:hypothetical protein OE88DRAFT_1659570 [Heliocybe sulcata]|uniref:Uncharacterized protein n=1 Tax=Heliocybe sulcata TaxID=5364 RepID=A0A5C3N245_9AGAM|nr:hypothetical protein OE88DRAFT_1659570 [Heliocybe sulcata]